MNLPKLRLLKVDIEGMELEVVKGAVKTIKCVPCFESAAWVGVSTCTLLSLLQRRLAFKLLRHS
jgi:hypothetical protein